MHSHFSYTILRPSTHAAFHFYAPMLSVFQFYATSRTVYELLQTSRTFLSLHNRLSFFCHDLLDAPSLT